jgi:hypothetical protein
MILVKDLWRSPFQLVQTFFGLSSSYRDSIYTEIHEIVFNGNGGYGWEEVYNMPIRLRRFVYNKLLAFYKKQNEDKNTINPQPPEDKKILRPGIISNTNKPPSSYNTTFSRKK